MPTNKKTFEAIVKCLTKGMSDGHMKGMAFVVMRLETDGVKPTVPIVYAADRSLGDENVMKALENLLDNIENNQKPYGKHKITH